ncbi:MAG: DMT family transporter [Candidatus Phaeomarinobacter sp.]
MSAKRSNTAWALLALLTACWASAFTFTAMALEGISPEWLVAIRQLIAALMLLPLALVLGQLKPIPPTAWAWLASLAIVGNVAPFYVISWGQQHIDSGLAAILITTMPLMTLALAHVFVPGERMTPRRVAGFAVGLLGVALIVGPEVLMDIGVSELQVLAQLAVLVGAILFAANAIIARNMPAMDLWVRSALTSSLAFVIILPIVLATTPLPAQMPSWSTLIGIIGTGVFASGLATVVYYRLIDEAGPTFMSLTNYLVPPVALIAGIVVLSERPSPWALVGLGFILAGIGIAELRLKSRP